MTDSPQTDPPPGLAGGAADRGPVLVVHGGAGRYRDDAREAYVQGVDAALAAGLAVLDRGAEAAVLAAVVYMESHTIMNAGTGCTLALDGTARLDAGYMDGTTRRYGGVTGVMRCRNPVLLARRVSDEGDYGRLLGPPTGDALARAEGLAVCEPDELVTERARRLYEQRRAAAGAGAGQRWLDTVGAVALDARGRLAAAVSTGGMSLKPPGRIGDSPVVGAGFWAVDGVGACVATGVGEVLLRQGTSRRVVERMAEDGVPGAAARALGELGCGPEGEPSPCGVIAIGPDGACALDHTSREMAGGWARPDGRRQVAALWRSP